MYERLWSLWHASIGAAITLETLRLGEIKRPEHARTLAEELIACVFSFSIYRMKDDSLFRIKPTETILKAAGAGRRSLRLSDERALRFVLQQARLLEKIASGETVATARLERLIRYAITLSSEAHLEWERDYRIRHRRHFAA